MPQLFCESRNKHILIRVGKYTDFINLTAASVTNPKNTAYFVDALITPVTQTIKRYDRGVLTPRLGGAGTNSPTAAVNKPDGLYSITLP